MALKSFSIFSNENCSEEEINLEKKTGTKKLSDNKEIKTTTSNSKEEKIKETNTLEEPKVEEAIEIEIIEENIIKFNKGDIKKIYEILKTKYPDMNYFIRRKDNQLHIVKYNEKLELNVNSFVDSLFKYYSTKSKSMVENLKIKGNEKFSLIENLKEENFERVIKDISRLLSIRK